MKIFNFEFGKEKLASVPQVRESDIHGFSRAWDRGGLTRTDNSAGLNSHNERVGGPWVWFGEQNRFPNYLNDLVNSSGLHSAIVEYKKNLIQGGGIELIPASDMTTAALLQLKQFTQRPNAYETLEELVEKITLDYVVHGTVYLKVYWNSDHTKPSRIERIEPSRIRVGYNVNDPEHVKSYFYCLDWNLYGQYPVKEYPAFDTASKNPVEIYRCIVPNSAMIYNTLPSYAAATNWIQLDGEISTYHKANIENSINPSMTIKFYAKPANEEEKRKIVNGIQRNYAGSWNTGKAMVFFSDGKELAPDVEPVNVSNIDKQFSVTADAIQRNVCYAHAINPSLMGLKTPGSLGNSTEIAESYGIFKETVINPAQRDIAQILNKFLKMNGWAAKIELVSPEINYGSVVVKSNKNYNQ
jgi:hypothetical protein